jgi:hypothetical protein
VRRYNGLSENDLTHKSVPNSVSWPEASPGLFSVKKCPRSFDGLYIVYSNTGLQEME